MKTGVTIRLTVTFGAIALLLFLLFGLAGCAGQTQTVKQGKELSASGIHYADIIDDLIATTIDEKIEGDSDELLAQRKRISSKDTLDSFLKESDDCLVNEVKRLEAFHESTLKLKAYFRNLQALVDSNFQIRNASAVKELSDSIKDANKKLSDSIGDANKKTSQSGKLVLSHDDQRYLSHLTGLGFEHIQAMAVRTALKRDAVIIGEQLLLYEKLIATLKDILADRYQSKCDDFRQQKVRRPYIAGSDRGRDSGTDKYSDIDKDSGIGKGSGTGKNRERDKRKEIGSEWKKDRRLYIDCRLSVESLDRAVEAAKRMQVVWEEILQGEEDVDPFSPLLEELNESMNKAKNIQNEIERSLEGIENGSSLKPKSTEQSQGETL